MAALGYVLSTTSYPYIQYSDRTTGSHTPLISRHFVVPLCYSTSRAAVELALDMNEHAERARAQTVLAEFPDSPVLLGVS